MSKGQIVELIENGDLDLDIDYSRTITLIYRRDNDGCDFSRDEHGAGVVDTSVMNRETWLEYLKDGVEYEVDPWGR